jgi:hypothetical protein
MWPGRDSRGPAIDASVRRINSFGEKAGACGTRVNSRGGARGGDWP